MKYVSFNALCTKTIHHRAIRKRYSTTGSKCSRSIFLY